jgi:hypothetical protein
MLKQVDEINLYRYSHGQKNLRADNLIAQVKSITKKLHNLPESYLGSLLDLTKKKNYLDNL